MRLTRLPLLALFLCASFVGLHAQSTTTATVLRPYITSLSPQSLLTGVDSTVLTINGNRFQRGAAVYFNAHKLTNVRIDGDSVIVAVVPGELTVNADVAVLLVENPDETRIGMRLSIVRPAAPKINSYLPIFCPATTNILRISGENFSSQVVVRVDNIILPVLSLSSTAITAIVPDTLEKFYGVQLSITNLDGQMVSTQLRPLPDSDNPTAINSITPPSITSGLVNKLVITGINFENALCGFNLKVMLGQINLTIINITRNQIIVQVPSSIQAGLYQLSVILFDGRRASQVISVGTTGVQSNEKNTTLAPNPATTALTLETTLDRAATLTLTLRNILGEVVLQEYHTAASGRFTATLDVSALSNGVYLLEVSDGAGGRWVQKVVKY